MKIIMGTLFGVYIVAMSCITLAIIYFIVTAQITVWMALLAAVPSAVVLVTIWLINLIMKVDRSLDKMYEDPNERDPR